MGWQSSDHLLKNRPGLLQEHPPMLVSESETNFHKVYFV